MKNDGLIELMNGVTHERIERDDSKEELILGEDGNRYKDLNHRRQSVRQSIKQGTAKCENLRTCEPRSSAQIDFCRQERLEVFNRQ